jgi:hypothetical protein
MLKEEKAGYGITRNMMPESLREHGQLVYRQGSLHESMLVLAEAHNESWEDSRAPMLKPIRTQLASAIKDEAL